MTTDDDYADDGYDEFTLDELVLIHRAVRHKLSRIRSEVARDRRGGRMEYARGKTAHRVAYAALLLKLDTLVPEEER